MTQSAITYLYLDPGKTYTVTVVLTFTLIPVKLTLWYSMRGHVVHNIPCTQSTQHEYTGGLKYGDDKGHNINV